MRRRLVAMIALLGVAALGVGCASTGGDAPAAARQGPALPQGAEAVQLDPADFERVIDNPFWPMRPGSRWVYRETGGGGPAARVEVTVTRDTKRILGIEATVVHDVVTENGALKEDTYDWYAQDRWGNVWYLGEDTKEYEDGKVVSTEGSWEAGVDGAQPGILVPARPEIGMAYRQEHYPGHAEDAAMVLSLREKARVPFGSFDRLLMTMDYTPLEPGLVEHKFFARGIGPILALTVSGGTGREELVRFSRG